MELKLQKVIGIVVVALLMLAIIVVGVMGNNEQNDNELFRIHIVANSVESVDYLLQNQIRDEFTTFLTPMLDSCGGKSEAKRIITNNINNLKYIADSIISKSKLGYDAKVEIVTENFPQCSHGGHIIGAGQYEGVLVTLGNGKGQSWWSVLFPPITYYNGEQTTSGEIEYRSVFAKGN